MLSNNHNIHREITPLLPEDCFLVFDRSKDCFDFPIHFHPEFELNFIRNGRGIRRIVGDSIEEVEEIELVLIGPNLYHAWEQHQCTSKKIKEITIQFDRDLFDEFFLHKTIMKPLKNMLDKSAHGIVFSKETSYVMQPRLQKVSRLDGIHYYMEMLRILFDLSNSSNQRLLSSLSVNLENFQNSDKIKQVYDYIQENFGSKITLEQVSNLVHMSNVSFNRFIKSRTGRTFIEYLNDVRIGYAARFLIEKDLSISEIAFSCGFNSLTNFNRTFKKHKGRTPTTYKEDFSGIKKVL